MVEIARITNNRAFFRLDLPVERYQQCAISGTARVKGDALVYRETQADFDKGIYCELRITARDGSLVIDDADGTCYAWCNERASLSKFTIPLASKRPIPSLPELRASQQYRSAIDSWKAGRTR